MKYVDEYRNPEAAQQYAKAIAELTMRPWTIMEICGGQTHTIVSTHPPGTDKPVVVMKPL